MKTGNKISLIIFLPLLLLLGGCLRFSLEILEEAELEGDEFHQTLAREYRDFSRAEASKYDWSDAEHFAKKGLQAASGIDMEPEHPEDWSIPRTMLTTFREARIELMKIVTADVIKSSPQKSARAYFLYDCWLEEQEENWQTEHIDFCRNEFFEVLNYLSLPSKQISKPAKVKKIISSPLKVIQIKPKPIIYLINFGFNSLTLSAAGRKTIRDIVEETNKRESYEITLNGHTDSSGSNSYNLQLSMKRAKAVSAALTKMGAKNIELFGFGESDMLEQTEANHSSNRRVEIIVR